MLTNANTVFPFTIWATRPHLHFHFPRISDAMVVQGLSHNCGLFLPINPSRPPLHLPPSPLLSQQRRRRLAFPPINQVSRREERIPSLGSRRKLVCNAARKKSNISVDKQQGDANTNLLQLLLWGMEALYILWLFLLPYAPGDPVWAISSETINSLVGLSLNFFFILPLANMIGIHVIEAPLLHPMSEGLFNFVIGWTFMFAPLLFTDYKRDRYKGSLDVLWGFQMFLTNTFLIPYMAIRLGEADTEYTPKKRSKLGTLMVSGAPIVGLVGGAVCVISTLWAFLGRMDGDFGNVVDRWGFLISYLGSERLAYAFVWDIALYTIFQPWLIGENLKNVQYDKTGIVDTLRFIPVVGLAAYLISLDRDTEFN